MTAQYGLYGAQWVTLISSNQHDTVELAVPAQPSNAFTFLLFWGQQWVPGGAWWVCSPEDVGGGTPFLQHGTAASKISGAAEGGVGCHPDSRRHSQLINRAEHHNYVINFLKASPQCGTVQAGTTQLLGLPLHCTLPPGGLAGGRALHTPPLLIISEIPSS